MVDKLRPNTHITVSERDERVALDNAWGNFGLKVAGIIPESPQHAAFTLWAEVQRKASVYASDIAEGSESEESAEAVRSANKDLNKAGSDFEASDQDAYFGQVAALDKAFYPLYRLHMSTARRSEPALPQERLQAIALRAIAERVTRLQHANSK